MNESITLIGFGEAGQSIAAGLAEEKSACIRVFDARMTGYSDDELALCAKKMGVTPFADLHQAISETDMVFSLVVGAAALDVGQQVAGLMTAGQVFIDLNSVSPATKKKIAAIVEQRGYFVEGAVMARVPPLRHKVPILLAGSRAAEVAARLNALGMATQAVGELVGQASANKMLRSVVIKGIEALLLECLVSAHRAGIEERILDSLGETFPGIDWRETASYYLSRTVLHGERRVTEMNEVAETIREFGLEPLMAEAASTRIGQAHHLFQANSVGPEDAENYPRILSVLAQSFGPLEEKT